MSGRAYARNPSGALGGATDIDSFVPHRFRIDAPKATNKAKELAIRRAIQQRCKEKNWKKLLRLRHTRLLPLVSLTDEQPSAVENGVEEVEKPEETSVEATPVENGKNHEESDENDTVVTMNGAHENGAVAVRKNEESEALVEQQAALEQTKQQLQEMEAKLATLSAEKHEKFQQLKDILIAEARSKMIPPMPKKRRVDSLGSVGTSSSPRLAGASLSSGSGEDGTGLSLLGAPNPSLLRAQSFSGMTVGLSTRDTAAAAVAKDTKRQ